MSPTEIEAVSRVVRRGPMEATSREHARASLLGDCEAAISLDRESALREDKIPPNAHEAEGRYLVGESVGQSSDSEAPSAAAPGLGVGSPPNRRGALSAPRDRVARQLDWHRTGWDVRPRWK